MTRIIQILILILFSCPIQAQEKDLPFDFPIKPNSKKWQSFKSVDEMYEACQIPQGILVKLTTNALIKTCLKYPASATLLIHNTPQQGFDDWKQHFNGVQELLKRNDASIELMKFYASFDPKGHLTLKTDNEKGQYTFLLSILENIIVQDEIIKTLNIPQQKGLIKTGLEKYQTIKDDKIYGFSSVKSTVRIIAKLSFILGNDGLKKVIRAQDAQEYIKSGLLNDEQILLTIISEAKKIISK